MVKRRKIVFIGVVCLIISFIGIYIYNRVEKKPYSNISESDIAEVYILFGIYEPYPLTDEEITQFVDMLKSVIIYQKDNSYVGYDGVQSQKFCIEKTNGKIIYISAANPFFIINGTGYRTEYAPCDKLSRFYHDMVIKHIKGE